MILHPPIEITARLLPGVRIGQAFLSIEYAAPAWDKEFSGWRTRYRYHIDLPDGFECSSDDLKSGLGHHGLLQGLGDLLCFLEACGESYGWWLRHGRNGERGENQDLFPPQVAEWAYQNSDELALVRSEIEQAPKPLIEE